MSPDAGDAKRSLVDAAVLDGIATITLDSVANRNALSARLIAELLDALEAATSADAVHAIVITGNGPVFCSGADLTDPPSNESGNRFSYPDVLQAIINCPKPVVAKVNGHARAGLGLIAACDIAIAPDAATFGFTEVRLGLVPAIIAVVCRRVMDTRAFTRLALVGETFDAAEAVASGLLTRCVPAGELDAAALDALIAEIRRTEPRAVARTKTLLGELADMSLDTAFPHAAAVSTEMFDSAEGREGIAAFREKRAPSWAW